uniref:Uncharacterized protein n=1 Tax=Brassica oleracea TaxID=3712 RepID=A0A3P6EWD7_BRAOL|nr:unnamed protein product [Brassica oleracea]
MLGRGVTKDLVSDGWGKVILTLPFTTRSLSCATPEISRRWLCYLIIGGDGHSAQNFLST